MKIKDGYTLDYEDDQITVVPGEGVTPAFRDTVILSDTAAFAFEVLTRSVSRDKLIDIITDYYDAVERSQIAADVDALLDVFRRLELLDEEQ